MDSQKTENAPNLTICHLTSDFDNEDFRSEKFRDSPIIVLRSQNKGDVIGPPSTISTHPLVRCNSEENKAKDLYRVCTFCSHWLDSDDTSYYLLREYSSKNSPVILHKDCIKQFKPVTNNPYHPKHSLQVLIFRNFNLNTICYCCYRRRELNFYCSICKFCICNVCEAKPPLLIIDHQKKHEHTLYYFPREASMSCDVCGLDERRYFLYICHQCDFVVHKECVYSPCVIKISRHEHRLSFISSFFPGKWICWICRKRVDENYGGYSCVKDCYYVAHTRCALHKDVWDGKELEEEPEEIYEDISPFEEIASGIIQHFSHNHQMILYKEIDKMFEDNKRCQGCALPVYNGDSFSCMECEFILHKVCANLPLKKQHVIHPHPLFLQVGHLLFDCSACNRESNSFAYMCKTAGCFFRLDVHCAAVYEPLIRHYHPQPLFLPSNFRYPRFCSICKMLKGTRFYCGECDFVLCFYCATLPVEFRYKHDEHLLTFSYEQGASGEQWCDVCEKEIDLKNGIYMCSECDITLHIKCLLGTEMYMLPRKVITIYGGEETDILLNNRLTRYICKQCNKHCENKIVYKISDEAICCSMACLHKMLPVTF